MPAEFKWNRLIIHAGGEGEFVACFEANVETLLASEYDEIECDLSHCIGLSDRAAALVQWAMVLFSASGKSLTLRLPPSIQASLQTTPIPRNVTVEWVMRFSGVQEAVKEPKVKKGQGDSERRKSSRPIPRVEEEGVADESATAADSSPVQVDEIGEDTDDLGSDEAGVRSDRGSEVHADTGAILRLSQADTVNEKDEATRRRTQDFANEISEKPPVGDANTTDRKAPVPETDKVTEQATKTPRGWKTSRWVDLGDERAFLTFEGSSERRELGQELLVGREPSADWIVELPTISKRHFRIFILRNRWHVQDMDSTNGTYLNYLELKGPPVPISSGDVIALAVSDKAPEGTARFKFEIQENS